MQCSSLNSGTRIQIDEIKDSLGVWKTRLFVNRFFWKLVQQYKGYCSFCKTGMQSNPGRSRQHSLPLMPLTYMYQLVRVLISAVFACIVCISALKKASCIDTCKCMQYMHILQIHANACNLIPNNYSFWAFSMQEFYLARVYCVDVHVLWIYHLQNTCKWIKYVLTYSTYCVYQHSWLHQHSKHVPCLSPIQNDEHCVEQWGPVTLFGPKLDLQNEGLTWLSS